MEDKFYAVIDTNVIVSAVISSLEISRIKKGAASIHIVTPPPVRTGLPLELKN